MNNFKCPMCTDCPDNCPLDNTEEDTREYSADYYKGYADGARELAEWFAEVEKVSELIKEYTINRWLEDFAKWKIALGD